MKVRNLLMVTALGLVLPLFMKALFLQKKLCKYRLQQMKT